MTEGQTVLVAGGSGEVGEPIVEALLQPSHTVVVPTRSADKVDDIRNRAGDHDRLRVFVGDAGDPDGAIELRDQLAAEGLAPGHVIASVGGWRQGPPLIDVDPADWHEVLDMGLTAHFALARAFLPRLLDRGQGAYVMINGGAGLDPAPGAGPVSVSAAAQIMLTRALAVEAKESGVRIGTLVAATPVLSRSRTEGKKNWLKADSIGELCRQVVEGRNLDVVTILEGQSELQSLLE